MKICSIDELKEHDILARDVLSDGYNVFLYKNTILNKKSKNSKCLYSR